MTRNHVEVSDVVDNCILSNAM